MAQRDFMLKRLGIVEQVNRNEVSNVTVMLQEYKYSLSITVTIEQCKVIQYLNKA